MRTILFLLLAQFANAQTSDLKLAYANTFIGGASVSMGVPALAVGLYSLKHGTTDYGVSVTSCAVGGVMTVAGLFFIGQGVDAIVKENNLSLSSTSNGLTLTYRF